jgi:hypothetical protein
MIIPVVTPWMKDLCQGICFGIDPCQVSPFMKITIDACEREVIKIIAAAMYFWNYVLYRPENRSRLQLFPEAQSASADVRRDQRRPLRKM